MNESRSPGASAADRRAGVSPGSRQPPRSTAAVPWLVDAGLVLPTVLVTRAGSHTAFVRVFPLVATPQAQSAGRRLGYPLERLLPEADWLLWNDSGGLTDARIGALADAFNRGGVRAFAYAGAGPPARMDAEGCGRLRRLGEIHPAAEDGTVFVEVVLHDPLFSDTPESPPSAQTVVYGPAEDLELLQEVAGERFVIEPVPEIGGVAALQIEHTEVAAGLTSLEALVAEFDAVLRDSGLQGPIHVIDRRGASGCGC